MDSRFLLLVIFILLFASMTMAFPMEGTDDVYQDGDNILDDLSSFAMSFVDCFVNPPTTVDDGYVVVDNLDGAVASPGTPRGVFQYPSPNPMNVQPYFYPPNIMGPPMIQQNDRMQISLPNPASQAFVERMPDLTALNVMQFEEPQPQQDMAVQSWVDDTYATGYRNQSSQLQQASADRPLGQQPIYNNTMPPETRATIPTQTQQPHQTINQPTTSTASVGYLQCDYPGCERTFPNRGALNHHARYHTPMNRRRYPCSRCQRRFLHPREVERHMTTHGIGPRHLCPIPQCTWAVRGFARRDHLLRHWRRCHATLAQTGTGQMPDL